MCVFVLIKSNFFILEVFSLAGSVFSLEQQVTCKDSVISQHLGQWISSACKKWDIVHTGKHLKLTLLSICFISTKYNRVLHVGALIQILSGTHSCTLCLWSPLM